MNFNFSESSFNHFFNSLSETYYWILDIMNEFLQNVILSHPILAFVFYFPIILLLIYLVFEFFLWAGDFRIPKDNIASITERKLKEHNRIKNQEERHRISNERFLANYEQRDCYYNAILMNKAQQQAEYEKYHQEQLKISKERLDEMKNYHVQILNKGNSKKSDKDFSFDINLVKERSRDTSRDIGTKKNPHRKRS